MQQSLQSTRGRPRNQAAHQAILEATLKLVSGKGFRAITMDQIAREAAVGKMTLYRRWPTKASLVMEALLELIGPQTDFPPAQRAIDRLRSQLHLQAKIFRSRSGTLIRSLLAEAQADQETRPRLPRPMDCPTSGGSQSHINHGY